jgi:hypothetical protein
MTPPDQLPAIIEPAAIPAPFDTYIVPALTAELGDQAGWRYVEFFAAARLCARLQPVLRLV